MLGPLTVSHTGFVISVPLNTSVSPTTEVRISVVPSELSGLLRPLACPQANTCFSTGGNFLKCCIGYFHWNLYIIRHFLLMSDQDMRKFTWRSVHVYDGMSPFTWQAEKQNTCEGTGETAEGPGDTYWVAWTGHVGSTWGFRHEVTDILRFCNITQPILVTPYRSFVTAYRSRIQGSRNLGPSRWGTPWPRWLMHCATRRKVAGSIPDGPTGTVLWHNRFGRTMALGLTQPLTVMSTRSISWG